MNIISTLPDETMNVIEPPPDETPTKTVLLVTAEQRTAERYAEWLAPQYRTRPADNRQDALDAIDDDTVVVVLGQNLHDTSPQEFLNQSRTAGYDGKVAVVADCQPNIPVIESEVDSFLRAPISESTLLATVDKLVRRIRYENCLDQYASLAMKRAKWETHNPTQELQANERYDALLEDLTRLEAELDGLLSTFEDEDFQAVFQGGLP